MKVASVVAAVLLLCIALPGPIQAKFEKPKYCVGKDGKHYLRGEHYEDKIGEKCIRYTCVRKGKKLTMNKKKISCDEPPPNMTENVTALEASVKSLEKSVKSIQKMVIALEFKANQLETNVTTNKDTININKNDININKNDISTNVASLQTTATDIESCLADITSSACKPPPSGKTSVVEAIANNTAALADKCDASTCKDIQATVGNLETNVKTNKATISINEDDISANAASLATKCDASSCTSLQTMATDIESCLADISSSACPPPAIGKTSVAEGIANNTAALDDKCDASTCKDIKNMVLNLGPGTFPDAKCFQEDTNIAFHDIGQNQYSQNTLPDWQITDGGQILVQRKNTRPSIGVSDIGDPSQPVSYNGRIFSDNSDSDVIGMVFGYEDKKNFFVVASSSTNRPGPINWYVGRVHATCGSSCHTTTTISDAIWNPPAHSADITVLKSGTDFWVSGHKYKFSICFNPSKLLMDITIINETNGNAKVLETGKMSSATGKTTVDDMSRGGGSIGVYVDSQQGTTWEKLECSGCTI